MPAPDTATLPSTQGGYNIKSSISLQWFHLKLHKVQRFTPALARLIWLLFLAAGSSARAQLPPAKQEVELQSKLNETDYGKFDGHGKLYFQALYQDDYPLDWHDTLVYYPQGSSQGLQLRHNLRAINVFLAAEIRRPATVRTFFKEYLWHFLSHNLGDGGVFVGDADIITQAGLNDHLDTFLVEADRRSASKRERAKAKLMTYARSGDAVIAGHAWTLDANVITNDGAIEHWLLKGRLAPLQIDSFLCEPKEPRGSFKTLTAYH